MDNTSGNATFTFVFKLLSGSSAADVQQLMAVLTDACLHAVELKQESNHKDISSLIANTKAGKDQAGQGSSAATLAPASLVAVGLGVRSYFRSGDAGAAGGAGGTAACSRQAGCSDVLWLRLIQLDQHRYRRHRRHRRDRLETSLL